MQFNGLAKALDLRYKGPRRIAYERSYRKGDEIGYFQQGSTIILFATGNYAVCDEIETGTTIRMGQALMVDTTFKE
jgi:phosphatidylserine decarboxylase